MGERVTYYMGSRGNKVPRPTRASDTNTVVQGIAKTGKVAPTGTVAHTEHRGSGQVDANVKPRPVVVKRRK